MSRSQKFSDDDEGSWCGEYNASKNINNSKMFKLRSTDLFF